MNGSFIACTIDESNPIHDRKMKLSSRSFRGSCCLSEPLCVPTPLSPQPMALASSFTNTASLPPIMLSECPSALGGSLLALSVS